VTSTTEIEEKQLWNNRSDFRLARQIDREMENNTQEEGRSLSKITHRGIAECVLFLEGISQSRGP
jgi:hypothetical protein